MFIHKEKKAVVLRLRDPSRVTTVIPTAVLVKHKGAELVAVPHRPDETRVLRNLGFELPDPMPIHYAWPKVSGRHDPFEAQRDTANFLAMHSRAFCLNDMGCVDASTEYLSPTGWRRMDDWDGGQVAQYHPDTGAIEFVQPKEYVKLPCEDMLRIKTKYGIDQLLSPEHRVLLQAKGNPNKREVLSAFELARRHDAWIAGEVEPKSRQRIGWSQAAVPTTFMVPGGPGLPLTDAQLRVQVAVIADGHFPAQTARCTMRLKRQRKVVRMHALLKAANIEYTARAQDTATARGFTVFRFMAPTRDKVFTPSWWQASRAQLAVVADEVMHWDGSISADKPSERFSTASKESADFVQYAFLSTQRNARALAAERRNKVEYNVQVRADGRPLQLASMSSTGERRAVAEWTKSPDGFKYCFMVPSTFLVFRRNGCVFASGNTGKTNAALWAYDYLRRLKQVRKMLVVCPLSTMERTWADSIFSTFPHLDCAVLHGTRDKRKKLLAQDVHIYIINIDGLATIREELAKREDIDLVVVDELALARNSSTERWKTLNMVCNKQVTRRVWGLTGSPTPNAPTDAWAQIKLVTPDNPQLPKYFTAFRDKVMRQITQFKWLAREDAANTIHELMQPAIRYSLDDCTDLPEQTFISRDVPLTPEQDKAYKDMLSKLATEYAGGQILAVNEAVKANKLIQIACLRGDTEVLTDSGWMPIKQVTRSMRVWDGEAWVNHQGAVYNGHRATIELAGVHLTEDHLVLSTLGWTTAQEVKNGRTTAGCRLDRADVRLPYRAAKNRTQKKWVRDLGVRMPLRHAGGTNQPIPTHEAQQWEASLRLRTRQQDARHGADPAIQYLDPHAGAMLRPDKRGLPSVRRAWYHCVRKVAELFRSFLGGYGPNLRELAFAGSDRQRWSVFPGQLPLGNSSGAGAQPSPSMQGRASKAGRGDWDSAFNAVRPEAQQASPVAVYDLVNCGPRSRFVVRGALGELLIVHNCGVAYGNDGKNVVLPSKPRIDVLREVIEESEGKVIVFVPLTGALEVVAKELRQDFSVEVVHGETSKNERDRIFAAFQRSPDPRVLVANAGTMSHGLTLTAATTVVWYAPVHSNETYEQACARVRRPGQTRTTVIVHIAGTDIERRVYKRLRDKQSLQGLLLDMMKKEELETS